MDTKMKIGIDISQIAFEGTGVAAYVRNLTTALVTRCPAHEFVLFGASLRKRHVFSEYIATLRDRPNVRLVSIALPPSILDILWNRLHVMPVEWFTGPVDIFWSSDWTQPPLSGARGVTTIHDLSILRFPDESHNMTGIDLATVRFRANIVAVQKRRLARAVHVCDAFFCDSDATRNDAAELLGLDKQKLHTVYPGFSLPI